MRDDSPRPAAGMRLYISILNLHQIRLRNDNRPVAVYLRGGPLFDSKIKQLPENARSPKHEGCRTAGVCHGQPGVQGGRA